MRRKLLPRPLMKRLRKVMRLSMKLRRSLRSLRKNNNLWVKLRSKGAVSFAER